MYRDCWEQRKKLLGDKHHDTLASLSHLVGAYYNLKKTEDAISLGNLCLKKSVKTLGQRHSITLMTTHYVMGSYYKTRKY